MVEEDGIKWGLKEAPSESHRVHSIVLVISLELDLFDSKTFFFFFLSNDRIQETYSLSSFGHLAIHVIIQPFSLRNEEFALTEVIINGKIVQNVNFMLTFL